MRSGIGNRRQSYHRSKGCIARHSDCSKRSLNAVEKTEKTRVRREGKRETSEGLAECFRDERECLERD